MEPRSPGYEKLVNEKPPISPNSRPFRMCFYRILSNEDLKANSTPESATTSPKIKSRFPFYSAECKSQLSKIG